MIGRLVVAALCSSLLAARPASADVPFAEGMVTITLDDSILSQYTLARPELNQRGYRATYFLTVDNMSYGGFMNAAQARELAAEGHEIGSHSVSHASLPALTDAELGAELAQSRLALSRDVAVGEVSSHALPFGEYSDRVLAEVERHYSANRTMLDWHNYADTDPMMLRTFGCESTTPLASLKAKVDAAVAERSWAIFLFHELTAGPPDWRFGCTIADFEAFLDHLEASRVKVVTLREGRALLAAPHAAIPFDLVWSRPAVLAGSSSTATVRLSGRAPAGGLELLVTSDRPHLLSGPATVAVPAGASSASFTVTTAGVAAPTAVQVSVRAGNAGTGAPLTIDPSSLPPVAEPGGGGGRGGGCSTGGGAGLPLLLAIAAALRGGASGRGAPAGASRATGRRARGGTA